MHQHILSGFKQYPLIISEFGSQEFEQGYLVNSMRRQHDRTLKEELPRSVGAQYATGDQWINNSRKNEEMEPKQKQDTVVDGTGDKSKVRCCKEQNCI